MLETRLKFNHLAMITSYKIDLQLRSFNIQLQMPEMQLKNFNTIESSAGLITGKALKSDGNQII